MKLSVAPLSINASALAFSHACTKLIGTSIAFSCLLMYNLLMHIAITRIMAIWFKCEENLSHFCWEWGCQEAWCTLQLWALGLLLAQSWAGLPLLMKHCWFWWVKLLPGDWQWCMAHKKAGSHCIASLGNFTKYAPDFCSGSTFLQCIVSFILPPSGYWWWLWWLCRHPLSCFAAMDCTHLFFLPLHTYLPPCLHLWTAWPLQPAW